MSAMEEIEEGVHEAPLPSGDAVDTLRKERAGSQKRRQPSRDSKAWIDGIKVIYKGTPTVEEALDFFTRTWDDDDPGRRAQQRKASHGEGILLPEVGGDEEKLLEFSQLDDLGIHRLSDLLEEPQIQMFDEKLPSNIVLMPSRNVPIEERISPQAKPYFLEEEGFYVGSEVPVSKFNKQKMEYRMWRSSAKQWFGPDGQLVREPDPLEDTAFHMSLDGDIPDALETIHLPPLRKELIDLEQRSLTGTGSYILDVDIASISFSHHPLFGAEHVIAQELNAQYQMYARHMKVDRAGHCCHRVEALRKAIKNIREVLSMEGRDSQKSRLLKARMRNYQEDLRSACEERDQVFAAQKSVFSKILGLWKCLKQKREQQGYASSSLKLQILEDPDFKEAEEWRKWEQEIETEVENRQEEYEEMFQMQLEDYRKELREWTKTKTEWEAARQRQDRRLEGDEVPNDNEELRSHDEDILSSSLQKEPVCPKPFERDRVIHEVMEQFKTHRLLPNETRYKLKLTSSVPVTPQENVTSKREVQRRNAMSKANICVKLIINNKEVSRTHVRTLGQDFVVGIGEIISCHLYQRPDSIILQVLEGGRLQTQKLAAVSISIPHINATMATTPHETVQFSNPRTVRPGNGGVGCGMPFKFEMEPEWSKVVVTSGSILCRAFWGCDENGKVKAPPPERTFARSEIFRPLFTFDGESDQSSRQLADWMEVAHLDPNDPKNSAIFSVIRAMSDASDPGSINCFRLADPQASAEFVDESEILDDPRFKILLLRNRQTPEFKHLSQIPTDLSLEAGRHLISLLRDFEKREGDRSMQFSSLTIGDKITGYHLRINYIQSSLQKWVASRMERAQMPKSLEDLVYEETVPDIGVIGEKLLQLLSSHRPLHPMRSERRKMNIQQSVLTHVKLVINVIKATNIPMRKDQDSIRSSDVVNDLCEASSVRPFVQVSVEDLEVKTSSTEGNSPTWNEQLIIPLKTLEQDLTGNWQQVMGEVVTLDLFDEMTIDILEDDRERDTTIHQRLERHWLGSLKIPLLSLLSSPRVEGTFLMGVPQVLLGYEWESRTHVHSVASPTGLPASPMEGGSGTSQDITMSLFITLNPPVAMPFKKHDGKYPSEEPPALISAAFSTEKYYNERFPGRLIKLLVMDITCKSMFVTRYVSPLPPPEQVLHQSDARTSDERVAYYVSLIPVTRSLFAQNTDCEMWMASEHFMSMLNGDVKEHALLLTNYFLHMGKIAWLSIGHGQLNGHTAFVVTQEDLDYFVWVPETGQHFSYKDPFCPMTKAWCLINADNVWMNIQPYQSDKPGFLVLDVNNASCWEPFFGKSYFLPRGTLVTVQNPFTYNPIDVSLAKLPGIDIALPSYGLCYLTWSSKEEVLRSICLSFMMSLEHTR
ncbi:unnamed protein product [Darwinula stevensoni]|uniref:C2 domain-containing protein n=1 Tax=Darwinula stevensoni TaxID=69355 RepID=A0A7R8X4X1_9CRUS|nr:unnamed protein product [Darwinula stevensoni]CAG0886515.1 unnamed protein product [Darwinula stevensoni]